MIKNCKVLKYNKNGNIIDNVGDIKLVEDVLVNNLVLHSVKCNETNEVITVGKIYKLVNRDEVYVIIKYLDVINNIVYCDYESIYHSANKYFYLVTQQINNLKLK